MELLSDLWLDRPDAHQRIDDRLRDGALTTEDAERLRMFVDRGYATMSVDLDQSFCDAIDDQIDVLLESPPAAGVKVSAPGRGRPKILAGDERPPREPGYRIPDLHLHSQQAMDLYLDPRIFRMIELIFDEPAVAFQSLYFEYGSMQTLHRDPMFVVTTPPSHLVAVWIALEDIEVDSGPLAYVPGSHRLPYFEFVPGSVKRPTTVSRKILKQYSEWTSEMIRTRGLEVLPFTAKRGDVFIWHAGLLHGGMKIENPGRTRKSFVVHFSTASTYDKPHREGMRLSDRDRFRA
jgi:phytanoyl-CoA hydroxylase